MSAATAAGNPALLIVPDASVLLKWVLQSDDEQGRDRALTLKAAWLDEDCQIAVPTLWLFEVGNVLGLKQPAAAEALLASMIDLRMPEEPPAAYLSEICRLMREFRVTSYDAAYHGLAIARGGTMLTADRKYARKAVEAGHVAVLDDWNL